MDKLRIILKDMELEEVISFLSDYLSAHTPVQLRLSADPGKPASYLADQLVASLCARLHNRLLVRSLVFRDQYRFTMPREEAAAFAYAWLTTKHKPTAWILTRAVAGKLHQALA